MAVQGKSEGMICERCFASVKAGSEFCPECGGPMGDGPAEGSDAAVYTELARANLLRMRGDYKAALEQCRAILHKFPNNVSANQLLGDLCIEMGDLEQGKEWYELALDIAPNSAQIQKKLADARQRLEQNETADMVEQIGLPPAKSKSGALALGLAGLVIVVGVIAYIVGSRMQSDNPKRAPQETIVKAPATTGTLDAGTGSVNGPDESTTPAPVAMAGPSDEQSLYQLLVQKSPHGSSILSLVQDPRTTSAILTYSAPTGTNERAIGADLAVTFFENSPAVRVVTVRAVRDGVLTFVADVRREAFDQTRTDEWKAQNASDSEALLKTLFSQTWPATTPTDSGANSTTAGNSGQIPGSASNESGAAGP